MGEPRIPLQPMMLTQAIPPIVNMAGQMAVIFVASAPGQQTEIQSFNNPQIPASSGVNSRGPASEINALDKASRASARSHGDPGCDWETVIKQYVGMVMSANGTNQNSGNSTNLNDQLVYFRIVHSQFNIKSDYELHVDAKFHHY